MPLSRILLGKSKLNLLHIHMDSSQVTWISATGNSPVSSYYLETLFISAVFEAKVSEKTLLESQHLQAPKAC